MTDSVYPEHEKMRVVKDRADAISGFLEWAQGGGYRLCLWSDMSRGGNWSPIRQSIEGLVADYLEIDLKRVEAEKRAMLEKIREVHHDQG